MDVTAINIQVVTHLFKSFILTSKLLHPANISLETLYVLATLSTAL
jgi:hypothetical protein